MSGSGRSRARRCPSCATPVARRSCATTSTEVGRHAARLVVLDPDGRLLLFRYDDPPPMGVHWLTPGGGLDDGETPREAAARELREETGWSDVEVGPVLGTGLRRFDKPPAPVLQHETHFLARVSAPQRPVDVAGHEVDSIAAWRWVLPDELGSLGAPVLPAELPDLLRTVDQLR